MTDQQPGIPNLKAAMVVQKYMHTWLKELEGAIETNNGMQFAFCMSELSDIAQDKVRTIMRTVWNNSDDELQALITYGHTHPEEFNAAADRLSDAMVAMAAEMLRLLIAAAEEETS